MLHLIRPDFSEPSQPELFSFPMLRRNSAGQTPQEMRMPPLPPRRLLSLSFLTITFQPSAEVHKLFWEPAPPSDSARSVLERSRPVSALMAGAGDTEAGRKKRLWEHPAAPSRRHAARDLRAVQASFRAFSEMALS